MSRYTIHPGTDWRGDPTFSVYDAELRMMIGCFDSRDRALAEIGSRQFKVELTPEGEQYVIPGCERPVPQGGQGSLF